MNATAEIRVSYKKDKQFIYQTIQIVPNKRSNIRFFMFDKYHSGRIVDDFLDGIYIGDGESIFFREKQKFRSQFLIKYEVVIEKSIDLNSQKFNIVAEVPKYDGCAFCDHFRPASKGSTSKPRCAYYKIFLDKLKIYCSDFIEKN